MAGIAKYDPACYHMLGTGMLQKGAHATGMYWLVQGSGCLPSLTDRLGWRLQRRCPYFCTTRWEALAPQSHHSGTPSPCLKDTMI